MQYRSAGRRRDRRRENSPSPDEPIREGKSRKRQSSNFDVKPESGIELPGVGSMSSTVSASYAGAQASAALQRYGKPHVQAILHFYYVIVSYQVM